MPGTVLLITDEIKETAHLRRELENKGVDSIIRLYTGSEAIRHIGRERLGEEPKPTLVLVDLQMASGDALQFLDWVKRAAVDDVLLVAISDTADIPNLMLAYQLGAKAYLGKPFCSEEVSDILDLFQAFRGICELREQRAKDVRGLRARGMTDRVFNFDSNSVLSAGANN